MSPYNGILCNKTVVCLNDMLYFICIDKHIGMADVTFIMGLEPLCKQK